MTVMNYFPPYLVNTMHNYFVSCFSIIAQVGLSISQSSRIQCSSPPYPQCLQCPSVLFGGSALSSSPVFVRRRSTPKRSRTRSRGGRWPPLGSSLQCRPTASLVSGVPPTTSQISRRARQAFRLDSNCHRRPPMLRWCPPSYSSDRRPRHHGP